MFLCRLFLWVSVKTTAATSQQAATPVDLGLSSRKKLLGFCMMTSDERPTHLYVEKTIDGSLQDLQFIRVLEIKRMGGHYA